MKRLVLALIATAFIATPAQADTWELAEGLWGWTGEGADGEPHPLSCELKPMRVSIDRDAMRYTTNLGSEPGDIAKILDVGPGWFSLQYDGETRIMDNGEPHVWYWSFKDEDTFVWVREDWIRDGEAMGHTAALIRCEPPAIS